MNIYSCVDLENIDKILVVFLSCYLNSSRPLDLKFYLLVDKKFNNNDISHKIPFLLKNNLNIKYINKVELDQEGWMNIITEFTEYFYKASSHCNHIMNFSRFFIFTYFPELERAIYLDWDMIVRGNVFELLEDYNTNKFIAASHYLNIKLFNNIFKNYNSVYKCKITLTLANNIINDFALILKKKNFNYVNLPGFNAGFYIVSKTDFNKEILQRLIKRLILIQKKNCIFKHGTQTILNLLTIGNIKLVNSEWNMQKKGRNAFKIYHWAGQIKPWEKNDPIWVEYKNIYEKFIKLNKEKTLVNNN